MFSTFEHFDLTITSGNKVFRLVTVYRPPTSRKNGFTVERFFSEFSSFLEELTVTSYQFLLCGDFNFHVDDNGNANAKQFHDLLFSADLNIVSRGEWLGRPANFKGAGYCLAFEVETGCHVTYTVHHSSQHSKQDGGR